MYTAPKGANPASAVVKPASESASLLFWSLTIAVSLVLLVILGGTVLPRIYNSIAGEEIVTMIGTVGGCIVGFVGTIIYNSCWTPGRFIRKYKWYEYVLSILTCLGFTFGFGIVMGLVYLVTIVIIYALAAAFVICIIVALLSGG